MSFRLTGVWAGTGGVPVGLGEGRPSGSPPICLRAPHALQGSALSAAAVQALFLPARSAEASQPLRLQLTGRDWGRSPSPHSRPAGGQPHPWQGGERPGRRRGPAGAGRALAGAPLRGLVKARCAPGGCRRGWFVPGAPAAFSVGVMSGQGPAPRPAGSALTAPAPLVPPPALRGKPAGGRLLKFGCALKK